MASPAFPNLRAQVFALYEQQAWAEALVLLEQHAPAFAEPSEAASVVFWQACFRSLLGRTDEALDTLESGLGRGLWWAEQRLRFDPDLQPLQGLPRLDGIIATCRTRCAEAERHVRPERLVAEPVAQMAPFPLLLALHGYDGAAAGTLPAWSPLSAHGWLVAALQSSQMAGLAGYHWSDEARTRQEVRQHLDELAAAYPLNLERLAIGGFSNGGRAALLLAFTRALPVTAVVSVGASLPDEALAALDWEASGGAGWPRLLWLVGERDAYALPRITSQAEVFTGHGVAVTVEIVPGLGHEVPLDLARRVASWLQ